MQPIPHNRPGRPVSTTGIRASAARHARAAIEILAEVARDTGAPAAERVRAAEVLLSYSTAKAAQ
jgi:hypothetical protein